MRASTQTKLSLYDFSRILGINPLHFGQVTFTPSSRTPAACDQAYFQYDWQDADRVSRESIAYAIAEAEELIERYLKYRLAPSWEVDEWRPTEAALRHDLFRIGHFDVRGLNQIVKAQWGHFISGGIEAKTLIQGGVAITYSDADSDGYFETATVSVAVAEGQSPCEIAVYYPGQSGDDAWEIRPIKVSIAAGVATITFRREQAVLAELLEELGPEPVDGTDNDSFLTQADVYRHWNDPQTQATLVWEPGAGCTCSGVGCAACVYSVQTACLYVRSDPKLSLVAYTPAEWDADDEEFIRRPLLSWRQPDVVRLYYYSGLRDKRKACTRDMDEQWKRTVAHFTAALLDRPPCDCGVTEWEYWREDLALSNGSDASGSQKGTYQMNFDEFDNPFGTRRGMLDAWRRVQRQAIAEAVFA
jgi:hypothetical protein